MHRDTVLDPTSVVLIGASPRPGSLGQLLAHNLLRTGFRGKAYFVNPSAEEIEGRRCYPDVAVTRASMRRSRTRRSCPFSGPFASGLFASGVEEPLDDDTRAFESQEVEPNALVVSLVDVMFEGRLALPPELSESPDRLSVATFALPIPRLGGLRLTPRSAA